MSAIDVVRPFRLPSSPLHPINDLSQPLDVGDDELLGETRLTQVVADVARCTRVARRHLGLQKNMLENARAE